MRTGVAWGARGKGVGDAPNGSPPPRGACASYSHPAADAVADDAATHTLQPQALVQPRGARGLQQLPGRQLADAPRRLDLEVVREDDVPDDAAEVRECGGEASLVQPGAPHASWGRVLLFVAHVVFPLLLLLCCFFIVYICVCVSLFGSVCFLCVIIAVRVVVLWFLFVV